MPLPHHRENHLFARILLRLHDYATAERRVEFAPTRGRCAGGIGIYRTVGGASLAFRTSCEIKGGLMRHSRSMAIPFLQIVYGCPIVAVLVAGLCAATPLRAQERLDRISRDHFDVIAPSERVDGEPGEMRVTQNACRVGPTHWARRRIVDIATQEWAYFGFQTIDTTKVDTRFLPQGVVPESVNPEIRAPRVARQYLRLGEFDGDDDLAPTIGGYWSAAPNGPGAIAAQNRAWNAPGGDSVRWRRPWSAAFISWVMCEAGLGEMEQFERSVAHRVYIDQAIRARDGDAPEAAFTAFDAGEEEIEPGDLLCNARGNADYRSLADRRPETGRFAPTHCDIVVKVDAAAQRFFVIGGNVLQSVSLTIVPGVVEEGRALRPIDEDALDGARTIFAHLKLNADPVEENALDNTPTIAALGEAVQENTGAQFVD